MLWPVDLVPTSSLPLPTPTDIPRRVALLDMHHVIIVTENGKVMQFRDNEWAVRYSSPRIVSYCLLEVSPSRTLIGLATIDGYIIILSSNDFSKLVERKVADGKIFSLHWLNEDTLLSCHDRGNLFVWSVCQSGIEEIGSVFLPPCKERWTTSATLCGSTVVYGDRAGNLHSSPISQFSKCTEDVKTVFQAHSKLGVCSLTVVQGHVWSTGRDGTVNRYSVINHNLTLVSSSKLPFNWVAQTFHTRHGGNSVLCFHENSVVLWSTKERRKLTSFECGGGHRSWSCLLNHKQLGFVYLKDKTAHILHCPLPKILTPVLIDGFHIREINSVAVVSDGWMISGGEDGTVRLSNFSGGDWTTHVVEHNHLSSVRSVHVTSVEQQILLFSAGGRAQIKAWTVNFNDPPSLLETSSVMLRDERRGRHWLNTTPVPDPETRYMDLHSLPLSEHTICVLAACSDAFLRVFHFDTVRNEMWIHKSVRSSQHCLLRVRSVPVSKCTTIAVTTATDGSVSFWDLKNTEVFASDRVHQSGVNGLSVSQQGDCVLVATGGDDNALSLSCYCVTVTPRLSATRSRSWTSSQLHSSVITGVEMVEDKLLSAGGDQRVSLLSYRLSEDSLSVNLLAQFCCSIPDIKGLTVLPYDRDEIIVCVYGVGVEVIQMEEKK